MSENGGKPSIRRLKTRPRDRNWAMTRLAGPCGPLAFYEFDTAKQTPTVAGIVSASSNHKTLLAAVKAAGLVGTLSDSTTQLTVFAPTDDAFAAALKARRISAEELLARKDLADILKYHVVAGSKVTRARTSRRANRRWPASRARLSP